MMMIRLWRGSFWWNHSLSRRSRERHGGTKVHSGKKKRKKRTQPIHLHPSSPSASSAFLLSHPPSAHPLLFFLQLVVIEEVNQPDGKFVAMGKVEGAAEVFEVVAV